jgi:small-conductance mechanosensitive channel
VLCQTIELLPENLKGRVIDRNMMFTVVREEGGTLLQIPNNLFFEFLENWPKPLAVLARQ